METVALQKKRKNIDLPVETLQKLSIMAASQGKSLRHSLKAFWLQKLMLCALKFLPIRVQVGTDGLMILIIWHLLCVVLRMQNKEGLKHIQ